MADIADVMDTLAGLAQTATHPNGSSLTGKAIDVGQGWPLAEDIDAAVKAGTSIVSVYLVPGAGGRPPQVLDFDPDVVTAPAPTLQVTVSDVAVTYSGTASTNDTAALIVDGKRFYSHRSVGVEPASVVASALLASVKVDYPQASALGGVLTITGSHSIDAPLGSVGTLAQKLHRQTAQIRLVVWSPNPADRSAIGRVIVVAVTRSPRMMMPDGYPALVALEGENLSDKEENEGVYRRDVIVTVTFDTIDQFQGVEIIGVQTTTSSLN